MFLAEMKKIWKPQTVLFIVVLSVLFFYSFMYQWIKPFCWNKENLSWSGDSLNEKISILSAWIEQYGNAIDQAEFREIEKDYNNILYQACSIIDGNDYFKENGVNNYEDYLDYEQKAVNNYEGYDYSVYSEMRRLITQNTGQSSIYFQEYKNAIQQYRLSGNVRSSILPFEVFVYTNNYLVNLMILCLICVFFVATPVMVDDREHNVIDAQYSSKTGKRTYWIQYVCMMFSSAIVTSVVIIMAMLAWRATGTLLFAESDLTSFLNMENFVVSITYQKYIIFFIIRIYLLVLGIGGILFYLSAHSFNVISMMLKSIPVFAVGVLIALLLQDSFCESNLLYRLLCRKYCEMIAMAAVFVIGIFLNVGNYKVLRRKDC